MKGSYKKVVEEMKNEMCVRCYGSGEVNDAEPGDIYFNTMACSSCSATGWKDAKVRHLITLNTTSDFAHTAR